MNEVKEQTYSLNKRLSRLSRQLAINLALFILSTLVALLLIEGVLRIVYPANELGAVATLHADDYLGWAYTPDSSQWRTSPGEFRTFVKINQNGLRNEEISYENPGSDYRILMLGDSFVAGLQSPLERTFVKVAEDRLNDLSVSPDQTIQVINAGTGGYGTDQELRWLRSEGIKYLPEMVVLAIYLGNDIADNDYELSALAVSTLPPKPFFQLEDSQLKDFGFVGMQTEISGDQEVSVLSLRRYLQKHSHTFRLASASITQLEGLPGFQKLLSWLGRGAVNDTYNHNYDIFNESPPREWRRAWDLAEALILAIRDEAEMIGAQFRVISIPHPVQVHQDWWKARVALYPAMNNIDWNLSKPNQQLGEILAKHGIPYLDLHPILEDYVNDTGHYIYYRSDGHFTDEGNFVVGIAISEWLADQWK